MGMHGEASTCQRCKGSGADNAPCDKCEGTGEIDADLKALGGVTDAREPTSNIINGKFISEPFEGQDSWVVCTDGTVDNSGKTHHLIKWIKQGNLFASEAAAKRERDRRAVIQKLWGCVAANEGER
tara:strand:- start:222 stop:599 length:378 start_codon:yes stop_codon:yes gene_type:complete